MEDIQKTQKQSTARSYKKESTHIDERTTQHVSYNATLVDNKSQHVQVDNKSDRSPY